MNYSDYIYTKRESFISKYNDFIVDHHININYNDESMVTIQIINSTNELIAYNVYSFDIEDNELRILSLKVIKNEYKGQLIGTFLILLSLEFVYEYTNIIGLSAMTIQVTLDDMSANTRKIKNIYRFAGLHYQERDSMMPEMLSSLIHTIRICDNYFKSKSKSIINTRATIFNRNNNYFLGGAKKNLQSMIKTINSLQDVNNKGNIYMKKQFKTTVYDIDTEIKQYYIICNLLKKLKNKFSVLKFIFSKKIKKSKLSSKLRSKLPSKLSSKLRSKLSSKLPSKLPSKLRSKSSKSTKSLSPAKKKPKSALKSSSQTKKYKSLS